MKHSVGKNVEIAFLRKNSILGIDGGKVKVRVMVLN
jgi:hypothetical protein